MKRLRRTMSPLLGPRLARAVRKAVAGDAAAFRWVYRTLHPRVYGFIGRRVPNEADTEELTAMVFTKLVENLDRYDSAKGSVVGWVMTMARNAVIDHYRAQHRSESIEAVGERIADAVYCPATALDTADALAQLRGLLAQYPPAVRQMFALRFADGLRYREIGQVMGLGEVAVKQRFSRTLRELRAKLRELEVKGGVRYAL